MQVQLLEDHLQAEQHRLVTMSGFMRLFRKRSVTATLDNLAASIDSAQDMEERLMVQYDELQHRMPPDTQGLDIPTKRVINFMILSFAQQMFLHFRSDGLAGMAKEAGDKSVGAINYGGKTECDEIIERVRKRVKTYDKAKDFADILQQRAKLLAEHAIFRSNADAVPASGSVATVYEITSKGVIKERDANLLGENYWNLSENLSR